MCLQNIKIDYHFGSYIFKWVEMGCVYDIAQHELFIKLVTWVISCQPT